MKFLTSCFQKPHLQNSKASELSANKYTLKALKRAEEINETQKEHPPLFCISFDLDNTLIKDVSDKRKPPPELQERRDSGLFNDYKDLYPNQDFIETIKTTIDKLVKMGIPILPIIVTSNDYIRPAIIIQSSPLKEIFSPKQIYARGTFTLKDNDKTIESSGKYHIANKHYQYKTACTEIDGITSGDPIPDELRTLKEYAEQKGISKLYEKVKKSVFKDRQFYTEITGRTRDNIRKDSPEYIQKFINQLQKDKLIPQKDNLIIIHFGDEDADKNFVTNLNNPENYGDTPVKINAEYQEINFQEILNGTKTGNLENASYEMLKSHTEVEIAKIISKKLHEVAQENYQDLYKK